LPNISRFSMRCWALRSFWEIDEFLKQEGALEKALLVCFGTEAMQIHRQAMADADQ